MDETYISPMEDLPMRSGQVLLYIREYTFKSLKNSFEEYEVKAIYNKENETWNWLRDEEIYTLKTEEDLTQKGCRISVMGWKEW